MVVCLFVELTLIYCYGTSEGDLSTSRVSSRVFRFAIIKSRHKQLLGFVRIGTEGDIQLEAHPFIARQHVLLKFLSSSEGLDYRLETVSRYGAYLNHRYCEAGSDVPLVSKSIIEIPTPSSGVTQRYFFQVSIEQKDF